MKGKAKREARLLVETVARNRAVSSLVSVGIGWSVCFEVPKEIEKHSLFWGVRVQLSTVESLWSTCLNYVNPSPPSQGFFIRPPQFSGSLAPVTGTLSGLAYPERVC